MGAPARGNRIRFAAAAQLRPGAPPIPRSSPSTRWSNALDILIVGAGNPDGIDFFRATTRRCGARTAVQRRFCGCPGVDLQPQFQHLLGPGGSSADPCDFQVYHGPSPFSEAENRNLRLGRRAVSQPPRRYRLSLLRREISSVPSPAGGSFIGAEPVPPADDAIYPALEASMNTAVSREPSGQTYSTGTTSNHAGTFDEYMYFGHRIFAFELEIGRTFSRPSPTPWSLFRKRCGSHARPRGGGSEPERPVHHARRNGAGHRQVRQHDRVRLRGCDPRQRAAPGRSDEPERFHCRGQLQRDRRNRPSSHPDS